MKKTLLIIFIAIIALAVCLTTFDSAWHRWGFDAHERIFITLGERLPKANIEKTLYDDRCYAVFFELPEDAAHELTQRLQKKYDLRPLESAFAYGIGDSPLTKLSGLHAVLPSRGDGFCYYIVCLNGGRRFVAIRAHYGI